jgi:hypothetical protein
MEKRPLIFAFLLAVGAVIPATAQACRLAANQTSMLHTILPAIPPGAVAAEVEIITDVRSADRPPLEARILSMIVGDFKGTRLRFDPQIITSCDGFPSPGTRGIAVGYIRSASDDVLLIDPIREPSESERQRQPALDIQPSIAE